jgi:hypothetical protein
MRISIPRCVKTGPDPRRSRLCCLTVRVGFWVCWAPLRRGGEVAGEGVVGFDRDDLAVLLPGLLEQGEDELAPLGGVGLDLPEAGEAFEQRLCAVGGGSVGGPRRWTSSSSAWRRITYCALVRSPRT